MTNFNQRRRHWNAIYLSKASESVSWFQPAPSTALALIEEAGAGPGT